MRYPINELFFHTVLNWCKFKITELDRFGSWIRWNLFSLSSESILCYSPFSFPSECHSPPFRGDYSQVCSWLPHPQPVLPCQWPAHPALCHSWYLVGPSSTCYSKLFLTHSRNPDDCLCPTALPFQHQNHSLWERLQVFKGFVNILSVICNRLLPWSPRHQPLSWP